MRIALDARTIYAPSRRGTGKNLLDLYTQVAGLRPEWEFLLFHRGRGVDDPFAGRSRFTPRKIDIRGDRLGLWSHLRLPVSARMAGADLMHCPANIGSRWPLVPMVVTIHDLIPLEPGSGHPRAVAWGRAVACSARMARRVITPSAYSKGRIVEAFGVPEERVEVVHWAPDRQCRQVTDAAELRRVRLANGLDADRPYVLAFGGEDPRKNTLRILEAWSMLPEALRREQQLLVIGVQESVLEGFRERAGELGIEASCRVAGFAPEADIAGLLSGATLLCYTSLSEGFGLPVLDAFVCRTAVLTSNVTSLPEVAGDAAMLVDPRDAEAISAALNVLLSDDTRRGELVERGVRRAEQFSWDHTARRVVAVFEQALEGGG